MAEEQEEIERSISALEKHITDGHAGDSEKERIWTKLQARKRELEKIIEHQTKGGEKLQILSQSGKTTL